MPIAELRIIKIDVWNGLESVAEVDCQMFAEPDQQTGADLIGKLAALHQPENRRRQIQHQHCGGISRRRL
jgi:hypothetical protein